MSSYCLVYVRPHVVDAIKNAMLHKKLFESRISLTPLKEKFRTDPLLRGIFRMQTFGNSVVEIAARNGFKINDVGGSCIYFPEFGIKDNKVQIISLFYGGKHGNIFSEHEARKQVTNVYLQLKQNHPHLGVLKAHV